MNLTVILISGVVLSILFHIIGVYANAKKTVWVMLALVWAGSISIVVQEISPKGYAYIETIRGQYEDTDRLIQEAEPEISLYEMLTIRKSISRHEEH